jgi:hypothetical protein
MSLLSGEKQAVGHSSFFLFRRVAAEEHEEQKHGWLSVARKILNPNGKAGRQQ